MLRITHITCQNTDKIRTGDPYLWNRQSYSLFVLRIMQGAAAPSTEAAVALGPAVMLIFIVFGGLYVNAENVPRWVPTCVVLAV